MTNLTRAIKKQITKLFTRLFRSKEKNVLIQDESTAAPTEFTLFSSLPPEIRAKVWSFAAPAPAFIRHSGFRQKPYLRLVPALLHTCRESRAEFLSSPGTFKPHPTFSLFNLVCASGPFSVYLSLSQDVFETSHLLFLHEMSQRTNNPALARQIPWDVAFGAKKVVVVDPFPMNPRVIRELEMFPGVETVVLLSDHEYARRWVEKMGENIDLSVLASNGQWVQLQGWVAELQEGWEERTVRVGRPRRDLAFKIRSAGDIVWNE